MPRPVPQRPVPPESPDGPQGIPPSHVERFGEGHVPPRARLGRAEVAEWLARTRSPEASARRAAVQALCPCHVRADEDRVWDRVWERVLALLGDPDRGVRSGALHALTDGSPRAREPEVVAAIEGRRMDPDPKLRRRVRRFLAQYRRTGRVNVG